MRAELTDGSLVLRLGRHFGPADAERLAETIRCFSPFSRLTLDFTDVRTGSLYHVQDNIRRITHRNSGAFLQIKAADTDVVTGGACFRSAHLVEDNVKDSRGAEENPVRY